MKVVHQTLNPITQRKLLYGNFLHTLHFILKIARALECSSAELMADTERRLEGIEL